MGTGFGTEGVCTPGVSQKKFSAALPPGGDSAQKTDTPPSKDINIYVLSWKVQKHFAIQLDEKKLSSSYYFVKFFFILDLIAPKWVHLMGCP